MTNPFIGQITLFAGNFAPRAFAFCDGQLMAISQNTALFSILGTTYGGDGRTTFALPDLRGRVSVNPRRGPGLSTYMLGQRGGIEEVTLNILHLPSHNHLASASSTPSSIPLSTDDAVNETPAVGDVLAVANYPDGLATQKVKAFGSATNTIPGDSLVVAPPTIMNTGGSQSHENMRPFLAVNYIIALFGTYPSRS
jgi:microcystin-dependent protein